MAVRSIASADIAAAYIPLRKRIHLGIDSANGAAVVIAPGIAVTVGHNANLIDPRAVLGKARDYDLLFFRTGLRAQAATVPVQAGMAVTAYGQGDAGDLRLARGVVHSLQTCPGCTASAYFTFAADAGPGFSGGPVLDGQGRLVGITFGYRDGRAQRLIYAYDMMRVEEELRAVLRGPATDRR
jgi:hypothetical protein